MARRQMQRGWSHPGASVSLVINPTERPTWCLVAGGERLVGPKGPLFLMRAPAQKLSDPHEPGQHDCTQLSHASVTPVRDLASHVWSSTTTETCPTRRTCQRERKPMVLDKDKVLEAERGTQYSQMEDARDVYPYCGMHTTRDHHSGSHISNKLDRSQPWGVSAAFGLVADDEPILDSKPNTRSRQWGTRSASNPPGPMFCFWHEFPASPVVSWSPDSVNHSTVEPAAWSPY